MSTNTTTMAMGKAADGDNAKVYLETTLGAALDKLDAHDHSGTTKGLAQLGANITLTATGSGQAFVSNDAHCQHRMQDQLSIANNGTAQLVTGTAVILALAFIVDTGGSSAILVTAGGSHSTAILSQSGTSYSTTATTAAKTNVYWSSGNTRYEIENKTGGTLQYAVQTMVIQ